MKSNFTRRMYIILIVSVLVTCTGVLVAVYSVTYNTMVAELKERSNGVRDYIADSILFTIDFTQIAQEGEQGDIARLKAQEKLDLLLYVGNFKNLYFAYVTEAGEISTTLLRQNPDGTSNPYVPTGAVYEDLRRSIDERSGIVSNSFNRTEEGMVHAIFWPTMVNYNTQTPLAIVGMEFNVDHVYHTLRNVIIYSSAFCVLLIAFILVVAYLTIYKTTEPLYKKMAYLDFLTGIQNRLAYEQKLVSCESLLSKGTSITIIIFDVNNLKTINDTLGHRQGDSYITNTAKIISEDVGNMGDTYRIGGDEFAAIIVGHEQTSIDGLLKRLRSENRPVLHNTPFNCAFGAATYTPGIDAGLNDLANRADQEMYREKRSHKR